MSLNPLSLNNTADASGNAKPNSHGYYTAPVPSSECRAEQKLESQLTLQDLLQKLPPIPVKVFRADDLVATPTSLGCGNFSSVKLYHCLDGGRPVAVKFLLNNGRYGGDTGSHILKELSDILPLPQCPHLVEVLGIYATGNIPTGIVMEYCDKGNLSQYLKASLRDKSISYEKILEFLLEIAKGLEFLHANKVVYSDLKPDNILLKSEGDHIVVKIGDYGTARLQDENGHAKTKTLILGDVSYAAPESLIDKGMTAKTDIFSFGILSWNVMYLETLYLNNGRLGTAENAKHYLEVLYSKGKRPECPEIPMCSPSQQRLLILIKKCWRQDANERPSATEIVTELKEILELEKRNPTIVDYSFFNTLVGRDVTFVPEEATSNGVEHSSITPYTPLTSEQAVISYPGATFHYQRDKGDTAAINAPSSAAVPIFACSSNEDPSE